ncbi:MAG: transglycosylase domain-containing protein [Vampirovibrionales bacterium]
MWKFLGVTLALLLVALIGGIAIAWGQLTKDMPSVRELISQRKSQIMSAQNSTVVYANDKKTVILRNERFSIRPVKLEEVAPAFPQALVATEDRRFYAHKGVDPVAIGRAILSNTKGRGVKEGGSTLTQQLSRLLFLNNERTLSRKIKEIILSVQLEQQLSKSDILELYMNYVYFGQGAYGIEAASEVYFNKTPKQLTVAEACLLAGLPQAPSAYNPMVAPEKAVSRRNEVIQNLVEIRSITAEEAKVLQKTPLKLTPNLERLAVTDKAPYFNQVVRQQTQELLGLSEQEFWQAGLSIYTTLDPKANESAQDAIASAITRYKRTAAQNQVMLMAMDTQTGAVLSYEGGKKFSESQYDRLQRSPRSPGSLFKVFTYTEAIRQGYSPYDVRVDEPISYGTWKPHNYDKKFRGAMTLTKALSISNNIIAVKLMNELSPQSVIATAKEMGIDSPVDANLASTLGGSSMYMVELIRAFGTLSNHGMRVNPYFIESIDGAQGENLFTQEPVKLQVLDTSVADTMTKMLQSVITSGTGRAAQYGGPAAGKTGTSDDYRDAWFIGYTPNVVAGVWMGNDDNTPMPRTFTGGVMPAVIWRSYMSHAGFPRRGFTRGSIKVTPDTENTEDPSKTDETAPLPETVDNTDVDTTVNPDAPIEETVPVKEPPSNLKTIKSSPPTEEPNLRSGKSVNDPLPKKEESVVPPPTPIGAPTP